MGVLAWQMRIAEWWAEHKAEVTASVPGMNLEDLRYGRSLVRGTERHSRQRGALCVCVGGGGLACTRGCGAKTGGGGCTVVCSCNSGSACAAQVLCM